MAAGVAVRLTPSTSYGSRTESAIRLSTLSTPVVRVVGGGFFAAVDERIGRGVFSCIDACIARALRRVVQDAEDAGARLEVETARVRGDTTAAIVDRADV